MAPEYANAPDTWIGTDDRAGFALKRDLCTNVA